VVVIMLVVGMATAVVPRASGQASVRGFDGTTIKVAGLGIAQEFAGADVGTKARFNRFNNTHEINGIKLKYTEFADTQADPATALSEARRLVEQEQVFAIVPDLSAENPGSYFAAQQVPYFGQAYDATYCSSKPTTSIWGFGYGGCLLSPNPQRVVGISAAGYFSTRTRKLHPSIVIFSTDDQSGKNAVRVGASAAQFGGFDVVYAKGSIPSGTSDYTPYVQAWLTADRGKPADIIECLTQLQCLQAWNALKAVGYAGVYETPLFTNALLKQLAGTIAIGFYNSAPNPGLERMQKDFTAVAPGTQPDLGSVAAYFGADMFISALKKAAAKGKHNITPRAVQQAAATQTWQIPGLVGPTVYPASTVMGTPACGSLVADTDGTAWTTVVPYGCSTKTYPINRKFKA
jgi:ABC-type branched-subunit amino acid transport system substrate-binding protein